MFHQDKKHNVRSLYALATGSMESRLERTAGVWAQGHLIHQATHPKSRDDGDTVICDALLHLSVAVHEDPYQLSLYFRHRARVVNELCPDERVGSL